MTARLRQPTIASPLLAVLLFASAAALTVGPPNAQAGFYTVSGTCGIWSPWNTNATGVTVYGECPRILARNVGGAFTSPAGHAAGWRFNAPAGTRIWHWSFAGYMQAAQGWQTVLYREGAADGGASVISACPGYPYCPAGTLSPSGSIAMYEASAIVLQTGCASASGCPNSGGLHAYAALDQSTVTLVDRSAPAAAITGGGLVAGGWKRGSQAVTIAGSDNIGIKAVRVMIDGNEVKRVARACNFGQPVPCSNGAETVVVDTQGLADGRHALVGQAIDASDEVGASAATTIHVDNHAPGTPQQLRLVDGTPWRTANRFPLDWVNPSPWPNAPLAGAVVDVCPASNAPTQTRGCVRTSRPRGSRRTFASLPDVRVPREGAWQARVSLVDAAGNYDPSTAATVTGLGFDQTPPKVTGFADSDPRQPTVIRVQASDAVSGIARGEIEVRRQGQEVWRPLPTQVVGSGLSAVFDDERLRNGVYDLRARAFDRAGLVAETDRTVAGRRASLRAPLRVTTRLVAGKPGSRRCERRTVRRDGKRRSRRVCERRLMAVQQLRFGQGTRIRGRLWARANRPLRRSRVEVWQRVSVDGAGWRRIGKVTTSRAGRFSYKTPQGPARTLRFRYPGTSTIRPSHRDVELRVRADTTLRSSRRLVVNRELVTFSGRLKGRQIPPGGTLVELQVYSRGRWRTFAQPRANPTTGRWTYQYQFETIQSSARFRFRARIRRQRDYPYATGTSRSVVVRAKGL